MLAPGLCAAGYEKVPEVTLPVASMPPTLVVGNAAAA